jgi:hypothetical protein
VRTLVAAPRPEPAFFAGRFLAVDVEVDRRAGARVVAVLVADGRFAEAFFVDLGGLACLTTTDTLSRRAAENCSTSSRAPRSPARARSAALATLRARFLRNPASRRSCSIFFLLPIRVPFFGDRIDRPSVTTRGGRLPDRADAGPDKLSLPYP